MIASLWNYRDYVRASVARELRLRYAGSALGALWQVLSPLAMIAIYTIVFSGLMRARLEGVGDPYAYTVYVCSGLLAWTMFQEIITRSQTMFLDHANLLKKARFPRTSIPAIIGASALSSSAIVYAVFLVLLAISGRWPGAAVLAAPLPLLLLALLGLSAGVLLGIVHVFFRDVGHVLAIALQVWFWLTPIVYPARILPASYIRWMGVNPVTPIVEALQDIFVRHTWPQLAPLGYPALVAAGLSVVAALAFRRQAPFIVDEL